ncbi:MAG: HEAT repeat domain-containing protein [Deltaproteobacteria bacterium]|nr:HEAT repeat domain-containing protein [Deltaproteobacteria bacterium]
MRIAALLALCGTLAACRPADLKNPETWINRLDENDPKRRVQAVQELRKLKAKQAAPQVAAMLKDPLVREEAAAALTDLAGPTEVQPLIDAIDTAVGAGSDAATRQTNRTNAKIAEALGNIGDPKSGEALLRLARAKDDLVRLAAVQSLGLIQAKTAVPELARLIDDDSSPPILVKKAVVSLGQIGDASGIPALLHALVMEKGGVSFLAESSFALFLIGEPSVEPLLKLMDDKDAAWLAWAKENHRVASGTYAKAALVLGDLGDARAIPSLMAKLKYTDNDPMPGTAHLLTNLVRQFSADALGRLHAKEAAGAIANLVATKEPGDEDLTTFAVNALVYIGDRAQAKEVFKRGQTGLIRARMAALQGVALLADGGLKKDFDAMIAKEKKGKAAECAKSVQELTTAPTAEEAGACDKLAASFSQLLPPLAAAEECKEEAKCWAGKLAAPEALVRARAAFELGRAKAVETIPALTKAATEEDLMARLAGIRALEWMIGAPNAKDALKAALAPVNARLQAEQGQVNFIKVNEELKRLQVKLARL